MHCTGVCKKVESKYVKKSVKFDTKRTLQAPFAFLSFFSTLARTCLLASVFVYDPTLHDITVGILHIE
jgi:hypothetical protein